MIISLYCLKYLKNMEWYTEDRNHSVPWYCIYDYYNVISTTATGVFVTVSNIAEEYTLALSLSRISRGLVDLFCTVKTVKLHTFYIIPSFSFSLHFTKKLCIHIMWMEKNIFFCFCKWMQTFLLEHSTSVREHKRITRSFFSFHLIFFYITMSR